MSNTEVLILDIHHLYQMEQEFHECFKDLFEFTSRRLRNAWVIKLSALRQCSEIQKEQMEARERIADPLRESDSEAIDIQENMN
jgi:hypothetical protein